MLSSGSIQQIISGKIVARPFLQILAINNIANDEKHLHCYLHDGTNLFASSIIPILPEISLVKDAILLLESYTFHHYPPLNQSVINVSNYKLLIGVNAQQALPAPSQANSKEASPDNLSNSPVNHPVDLSSDIHDSINTSFDDIPDGNSDAHSFDFPSINSPSGSKRRSLSVSSFGFTPASAVLSKRSKISHIRKVLPISNLTSQSSWTIRGRVLSKSSLGNLSKGGHWFHFVIGDTSGRIKVNAFGIKCTEYFDVITLDKIFSVSRGKLVSSNTKYNSTGHPKEINLNDESIITELTNFDEQDFPPIISNFIKISNLRDVKPGTEVDTIGVCTSSTLFFKGTRRSVVILDDSAAEIRVSIWTFSPDEFKPSLGDIIIIRRAKMTHLKFGRLLTISGTASIEINSSTPEAIYLSDWYAANSTSVDVFSLTKGIFGDISSISSLPSTISADEVFYTNLEVTITSCTGQVYQACTVCSHKVKIYKDNIPVCEFCKDTEPSLKSQMVISFFVSDVSGSVELVAFTCAALELLQKEEINVSDVEDDLSPLLEDLIGRKFRFNVKTRRNTYHDCPVQHSIKSFSEVTPGDEE